MRRFSRCQCGRGRSACAKQRDHQQRDHRAPADAGMCSLCVQSGGPATQQWRQPPPSDDQEQIVGPGYDQWQPDNSQSRPR